MSTSRKTDDASPQLKQLFSSSNALAPNHAPLSKTLFPQVIDHKEWLPQSQEPFESRMQIPKGLRINRRNRTQEMPREPTQKHPADASGNNAFPYSHSQLSQGKFPHTNSLPSRVFPYRHVHARDGTLLGSIFAKRLQGCTHLYSPLSTLFVLTPRGVVTRPSESDHSRRSVMGSITQFRKVSTLLFNS